MMPGSTATRERGDRSRRSSAAGTAGGAGLAGARKHRPDYWLVILCLVMLSIGLIVVYSISPALSKAEGVGSTHYVNKQLLAIALSAVAFIATAKIPLNTWRLLYKPLLIAAAAVTLVTLLMPVNPDYPARRWISLGSFSIQSVEFLKFAVLIWLAGMLSERIRLGRITDSTETLKPLAYAVIALGIVVAGIQSDLGSMGVLVAMMGTMAFVAGMPIKRLLMIGGVIAAIGLIAISSTPYRRDRLATFLHPEQDCQAAGYQACQALIAVGSGGMVGLGLGRSVQAYGYLPEAANDSIFAIYAEKFGFLGVTVLLGILIAFFSRLKSIAERAPDHFSRLLVIGILSWLSVQAAINIGAMIGLLPLKGITLPLISSGGTSVIFVAAAVGLAFQVSYYTSFAPPRMRETNTGNPYDDTRDGRRLRGAYHPNSGSRARA
jgi:cell division protein FtsW